MTMQSLHSCFVGSAVTITDVVVGVTDIKPYDLPASFTANDLRYRLCGLLIGSQEYTRMRFPCKSATGSYVFIKKIRNNPTTVKLYEVEVYVQSK